MPATMMRSASLSAAAVRPCEAISMQRVSCQRPAFTKATQRVTRSMIVASAAPASNGAPKPAAAAKKTPAAERSFTNTLKFYVPADKAGEFEATWRAREQVMRQHAGFQGMSIMAVGDTYTVSSSWATIPQWELFSLSECSRRTHLPWGVLQYVPARGQGFPEDFVPFIDYNTPVDAKY